MERSSDISSDYIIHQSSSPADMECNSFKVDKAVKFLCLPEIKELSSDSLKAEFLKSKNLNPEEVSEAFQRFRKLQPLHSNELATPRLVLNAVSSNEIDHRYHSLIHNQKSSQGSSFFSFCRKLILIAGITSTFYYLYEKWLRSRINKKKTEKTIKDELNQIRNELAKISTELRQQQSLERNQVNLLSEINSLKAILVGRQYFEEKQTTKLSLPSWQLGQQNGSRITDKNVTTAQIEVTNDIEKNIATTSSHYMNGLPSSEIAKQNDCNASTDGLSNDPVLDVGQSNDGTTSIQFSERTQHSAEEVKSKSNIDSAAAKKGVKKNLNKPSALECGLPTDTLIKKN